jgi:hypothetical protein
VQFEALTGGSNIRGYFLALGKHGKLDLRIHRLSAN